MTVMTAYDGKYQRVGKSVLSLVATDLCMRYPSMKLKTLLADALVEPRLLEGKLNKEKVFDVLAIESRDSRISGFLKILEHITNPLLFGNDTNEAKRVLNEYIKLLKKENFHYEEGRWYVGPTPEEEAQSIDATFYYWRNSDGVELEPKLISSEKKDYYVTISANRKDFFYKNQKIEWSVNDDIYKAFYILFHSVNEEGFVTYADFEKAFKKRYPHDYKKATRGDLRKWILKNLTQRGEGILKKTKDPDLVQVVRKRGLQFKNHKLP